MLIRNITSRTDLEEKKKLQEKLLGLQIENEKISSSRMADYKNPNKPPPLPPQFKTPNEILQDTLLQQKEVINNLRDIGFDFLIASQFSQDLLQKSGGIANLNKFNRFFPKIKKDLTSKYQIKLMNLTDINEYYDSFDQEVDNVISYTGPDTTNFFGNKSEIDKYNNIASIEQYDNLMDRFIVLVNLASPGGGLDIQNELTFLMTNSPSQNESTAILSLTLIDQKRIKDKLMALIKTYKIPTIDQISNKINEVNILIENIESIIDINPLAGNIRVLVKSISNLIGLDNVSKQKLIDYKTYLLQLVSGDVVDPLKSTAVVVSKKNLKSEIVGQKGRKRMSFINRKKRFIERLKSYETATEEEKIKLAPQLNMDKNILKLSEPKYASIKYNDPSTYEFLKRNQSGDGGMDLGVEESKINDDDDDDLPPPFPRLPPPIDISPREVSTPIITTKPTGAGGGGRKKINTPASFIPKTPILTERDKEILKRVKKNDDPIEISTPKITTNPTGAGGGGRKKIDTPVSFTPKKIDLTEKQKDRLKRRLFLKDVDKREYEKKELENFSDDLLKAIINLDEGEGENRYFNQYEAKKELDKRQGKISGVGVRINGNKYIQKKIKIGRGLEIKEDRPRFKTFGKFLIHIPFLEDDSILNVRYPSTGVNPNIKPVQIDNNFKEFIIDVLESGRVNKKHYDTLTEPEKNHFVKISRGAGLLNKFNLKSDEADKEKKELTRLDLLYGEYVAGNDNISMIKEAKNLIKKYLSTGALNKNKGLEMLVNYG